MLEILLVALPWLFAFLIFFTGKNSCYTRGLLVLCAVTHLGFTIALDIYTPVAEFPNFLSADNLSLIIVTVTSILFFCAVINAIFWIPVAKKHEAHYETMPEHIFCALLCVFLSTMTIVAFARNFGLLWVAVEATTLASAPLISYHRSPGALEAMWKYLLICSVGIGLALLGTFILSVAIRNSDGSIAGLNFVALSADYVKINPSWFKAAFLFCFAGYGLKTGLAPFHMWLPDAHSEAPSLVSLLLSGSLLNCSFLSIIRIQALAPLSLQAFCREYFIGFGILSLAVAAFFMIRQADYKRMLAYSSVEHMGLIAILWGLGAKEVAMIHLTMHSVIKMLLFLTAGNILLAYGTRRIAEVHGLFSRIPINSFVWFAGILLICGVPPSPLFFTEYMLITHAGPWLASVILILLFGVFAAMTYIAVKMTMGEDIIVPVRPVDIIAEKLSFIPCVLLLIPLTIGVIITLIVCKCFGE